MLLSLLQSLYQILLCDFVIRMEIITVTWYFNAQVYSAPVGFLSRLQIPVSKSESYHIRSVIHKPYRVYLFARCNILNRPMVFIVLSYIYVVFEVNSSSLHISPVVVAILKYLRVHPWKTDLEFCPVHFLY